MKNLQRIKASIIVTWVLDVLLLLIGFIGLLMTPLLFDAPGSESSFLVWLNAILISSIPVLTIVLFILSIRKYRQEDYVKALKLSAFPTFYIWIVYFQFWLQDFL